MANQREGFHLYRLLTYQFLSAQEDTRTVNSCGDQDKTAVKPIRHEIGLIKHCY